MINQIVNCNKLINSFLEAMINCVSILNMRVQFRNASDEHREYKSSELLSAYADLYVAVFGFSSNDSDFLRNNTSSCALDKDNLIKLQELILSNLSVWMEFPNSVDFLLQYLYERCFGELFQRPAILYLLASLIKIASLSDKPCQDLFYKFLKPSSIKDDILKKEKYGSGALMPREDN